MAAPAIGLGAIFGILVGSTYTDIGEVVDIKPPNLTSEVIDTTTLAPTDNYRTSLPGVKDGGEVTILMNFDPATVADAENQTLLKAVLEGSTNGNFRIEFSDGGPNVIFEATVSGFDVGNLTVTTVIPVTFTAKVSGKPTWADS